MERGVPAISFSYGKWSKYQMMLEEETLHYYLPDTLLFSEDHFWELVEAYGSVVIKPSEGAKGYGVVQVTKLEEDRFAIHTEGNRIIFGKRFLQDYLMQKRFRRKLHIIQETIPLARIDGSPFDIRVVARKERQSGSWRITGKYVRLAADRFFATNVAKEILTIEEAVDRAGLKQIDINHLNRILDRISFTAAARIGEYYPEARILGFDIALTESATLCIIEANLRPERLRVPGTERTLST
jgi:hypothetical protein